MDDRVRRALARGHLIDITTIGRHSGEPRRIEIVFHNLDGRLYITGRPRPDRRRDWLLNLEAHPEFTFHLKGGVVADLPARARVIEGEAERRAVLGRIVETTWRDMDLEEMVAWSPLVEVEIEALAA